MNDQPDIGLDDVIRLSEAMLDRAHDDDWDTFTALAVERDQAIRAVFGQPVTPSADLPEAKVRIAQDLDEKLVTLSRQHRDALQQEVLNLVRARKSARAYTTG